MTHRIQRYQLFALFFLTLVNMTAYFYNGSLPDNVLSISSSSETTNWISYFFFSIFSFVNYYTGIWLVCCFFVYAFLYSFVLSRRNRLIDNFVAIGVVLFAYSMTALLYPEMMGNGLRVVTEKYISLSVVALSSLVFAVALFYICLQGSMAATLNLALRTIDKFNASIANLAKRIWKSVREGASFSPRKSFSDVTSKIQHSFANRVKKTKIDEEIITPRVSQDELTEESEAHIDEEWDFGSEDNDVDYSLDESDESLVETTVTEIKTNAVPPKLKKKTQPKSFFSSDDLIKCISNSDQGGKFSNPDQQYFQNITSAIEEKLAEFRIEAKIINILKGPVVDTFELELGSGIKVSKVTNLNDDIGLALNGAPIRIVYPMRGKSTIGIEVPRNPREIIFLDEVLKSAAFNSSRYRLPVAMGKDAFGDVSVVDLASMPHMLVAGATGAGKSVFVNTMLVSLIVKMSPRQMKLILIDPKQLELALYQDLPHLMMPVITEAKTASIALLWAVQEMERRYSILKEMGVKNIEGFNKKVKTCDQSILWKINPYYEDQDDEGYELPYLVVVIDEFADLILTKSGKEVEDNVNRLAAKARASGIHIVLATQRPSTDVVTGVIKANFPTRVSFRVTTGMDSKVVLDQYGAEKLLGRGDMLYKHGVDLMRLHSAYVEEEEIEVLVEKLSDYPSQYNNAAMDFLENGGEDSDEIEAAARGATLSTGDALYDEAVRVVIEQGQASASMLQRRLRVGYNRAANLVEEMEKNGVVGPQQGSKPRDVLVSSIE